MEIGTRVLLKDSTGTPTLNSFGVGTIVMSSIDGGKIWVKWDNRPSTGQIPYEPNKLFPVKKSKVGEI